MIKVTNKRFNDIRKANGKMRTFAPTQSTNKFREVTRTYTLGDEAFGEKRKNRLGDIYACYVTPKFLDRVFYNDIFNTYGEEMMLVYETLVDHIIKDVDYTVEVLKIAHLSPNLLVSQEIIEIAKRHAQQEIDDAVEDGSLPYVNEDIQSILK